MLVSALFMFLPTIFLYFFLFSFFPFTLLTLSLCNAMTAWWVSWTFLALLWYPSAVHKQAALPVKQRSLINPHLQLTVHTQGKIFPVPALLCFTPLSEFTSCHAEHSKQWTQSCVCYQSTERVCHNRVTVFHMLLWAGRCGKEGRPAPLELNIQEWHNHADGKGDESLCMD